MYALCFIERKTIHIQLQNYRDEYVDIQTCKVLHLRVERVEMHNISISHPDRVFYNVLDITRVPWGAQKLFSQ